MYKYVKRFIDIVLGIFILLLIWPIIVVIYIILKIDLGGKIIFKQERLGLNMKPFTIYKFKSMLDDTSLSHDERITKCSFVIRRSGMDELPNLFNMISSCFISSNTFKNILFICSLLELSIIKRKLV